MGIIRRKLASVLQSIGMVRWRAAHPLMKQHGDDALIEAAMRADALLEAGDLDGYAVWRRVVKAVEELLSKERPDGATVQ